MANSFFRLPITDEDENTWATYVLALEKNAIGDYTSRLYDDSGTLKISKGRIGINDGTNSGVSILDTVTTIDLSGVSNSNWAKIEMSVSGTAVTFSALDISGAIDSTVVPAEFKNEYVEEKNGFYISSNKRCIGIIYKNSSGNLSTIVNAKNKQYGYIGVRSTSAAAGTIFYHLKFEMEKGIIKNSGSILGSNLTEDQVYTAIEASIQNTSDTITISGGIMNGTTDIYYQFNSALRAATKATFYANIVDTTGGSSGTTFFDANDGDSTRFGDASDTIHTAISWNL